MILKGIQRIDRSHHSGMGWVGIWVDMWVCGYQVEWTSARRTSPGAHAEATSTSSVRERIIANHWSVLKSSEVDMRDFRK